MPSVNFRMTGEERDRLAIEAQMNGRSIQREIHYRVFNSGRISGESPDVADGSRQRDAGSIPARSTHVPVGGKRFTGPDPRPSEKKR